MAVCGVSLKVSEEQISKTSGISALSGLMRDWPVILLRVCLQMLQLRDQQVSVAFSL